MPKKKVTNELNDLVYEDWMEHDKKIRDKLDEAMSIANDAYVSVFVLIDLLESFVFSLRAKQYLSSHNMK